MKTYLYFVALRPTSIAMRSKVSRWLTERDAVNIFANNWLIKTRLAFAEDLKRQIEHLARFEGGLVVFNLDHSTDWAHRNVSDEADAWILENLTGPEYEVK